MNKKSTKGQNVTSGNTYQKQVRGRCAYLLIEREVNGLVRRCGKLISDGVYCEKHEREIWGEDKCSKKRHRTYGRKD